jgi:type I restriction enzyme S subunit
MSDVPMNWIASSFGEIAAEPVEQDGPQKGRPFTYVDIGSIDKETKRIVSPQQLDGGAIPNRAKQRVHSGDVLVSMTRPNLNAVARVTDELEGSIASTGFCVLRSTQMNSQWLGYRVQANDFISEMSSLVQGALYPAVRPKDVFRFAALVPPRAEQHRIVAEIEKQFTRLDAAVAGLKRVQANLKRYRTSVLKAACEGRLVPTEAELARKEGRDYEPASELLKRILAERRANWEAGQLQKMIAAGKPPKTEHWKDKYQVPSVPDTTELPELPEGWAWTSADQATSLITDGEHITPPRCEAGVLLLSARNVLNGEISLKEVDYIPEHVYEDLCRRLEIVKGDVLLSCSGSVGRSCVVPFGLRFSLVRSVAVLRPITISGAYLSYALRSPMLQQQIRALSTQTAQANIFQGKIRRLAVPLPPLLEQQRIVEYLDNTFSQMKNASSICEVASKRAVSLRQATLKEAFQGKLVPQDPSDESASVLLERIRAQHAMVTATNGAAHPINRTGRLTKRSTEPARAGKGQKQ